jgi:hypothetical protein
VGNTEEVFEIAVGVLEDDIEGKAVSSMSCYCCLEHEPWSD